MKSTENPVTGEDGSEHHPAFGMARVGRIMSTPGQVLFQSDIRHGEYIEITVSEASRRRDLKHDWVHPEQVLIKFCLSIAQFASFIASSSTEGVPVTIGYDHGDRPGLPAGSRLALTSTEVHAAAHEAFRHIQEAEAAYEEALTGKAPAAERKRLLANLRAAIRGAVPNVDYAADQLTRHAEEVVEKSRADIEAMAAAARNRPQLPAQETPQLLHAEASPAECQPR